MLIAGQYLRVSTHGAQRSLRGYVRTTQESYRCPLTWLIRNIHPSEYLRLSSTIWIFVRSRERERERYADIRVARTTRGCPRYPERATHTFHHQDQFRSKLINFLLACLYGEISIEQRRNIFERFTPCSNDPPSFDFVTALREWRR